MFLIHPKDFARRRDRCRPVVDSLQALDREFVSACNICDSRQPIIIARQDRYGLPIRTALCSRCGLVYVVDRFTAEGYARFYSSGDYRRVSSLYNGSGNALEDTEDLQVGHATNLGSAIEGYIGKKRNGRLLDIGGSFGWVAQSISRRFALTGTVLEPAPDEAAVAKRLGLDAVVASLEEWHSDLKFDLILLCKTIEHLFDLRGSLKKIRGLLNPGGLFYCDIVDFFEACRREGPPEVTTKIDHCYWLSQETAPGIFRSVGFEVVSMNTVSGPNYVGFLLRACEPDGRAEVPQTWLDAQVRRLREWEADWQDFGRTPYDAQDWLRRKAYRAKRKILSLVRG